MMRKALVATAVTASLATLLGCPSHDDATPPPVTDAGASMANASSAADANNGTGATASDAAAKAHTANESLLPPYPVPPPCDPDEETRPWVRSVDAAGPAGIDAAANAHDGSFWVAGVGRAVHFDRLGNVTATEKAAAHDVIGSIAVDRADHLYAATKSGADVAIVKFGGFRRVISGASLALVSPVAVRPSGDSYVAVSFHGKLTVEKVTLGDAPSLPDGSPPPVFSPPSLAVIALDPDGHVIWAHAYDTHVDPVSAALAVDALGNLSLATAVAGNVTFGGTTIRLANGVVDVALLGFDANGAVLRSTALAALKAHPLRLFVDAQMSTVLLARSDQGDLALKSDALGQEIYRRPLGAAGSVRTGALVGAGELAVLRDDGKDDAGAPRLAVDRFDRFGAPSGAASADHGVASLGGATTSALLADRCGSLTLATGSGTTFSVATHAAH